MRRSMPLTATKSSLRIASGTGIRHRVGGAMRYLHSTSLHAQIQQVELQLRPDAELSAGRPFAGLRHLRQDLQDRRYQHERRSGHSATSPSPPPTPSRRNRFITLKRASNRILDRRATFNLAASPNHDRQFPGQCHQWSIWRPARLSGERRPRPHQGIEADFSIRPSSRFNAYVNGAYTDAKYVVRRCALPARARWRHRRQRQPGSGSGGGPGSLSPQIACLGQVLPGVSKWALSYGGEANTPISLFGQDGEVYFGVDGSYRSKFSSNPSPSIYTWVDGYALTNFRLGFRADNGLNVYGWVRNAFNVKYFEQLAFDRATRALSQGA